MVDDQGQPIKLVAFGNVAHGVFAFGNVARGVVAVGSGISFGVFAFGTNAVGSVLAVGVNTVAPISIGLANAGGVFAIALANAAGGFGFAGANGGFSPYAAFFLAMVLIVVRWLWPKPPPPPRDDRVHVTVDEIRRGEHERGWVEAHLVGSADAPAIIVGGRKLEVPLAPIVAACADGKRHEVDALITATTRLVPGDGDYRAPAHEERTLACTEVDFRERPLRISTVYRGSLVVSAIGAAIAGLLALLLHTDPVIGLAP